MRVVSLLVLPLLCFLTPAFAEPGFSEKYERDYNIFNSLNQYRADNPLNPINAYDPKNPLNPINQYDPGNPANPINQYNPSNPFNPLNQYHPKNPLNPLNEYNPSVPLNLSTGRGDQIMSEGGNSRLVDPRSRAYREHTGEVGQWI